MINQLIKYHPKKWKEKKKSKIKREESYHFEMHNKMLAEARGVSFF
jgi:hypothetical protein